MVTVVTSNIFILVLHSSLPEFCFSERSLNFFLPLFKILFDGFWRNRTTASL